MGIFGNLLGGRGKESRPVSVELPVVQDQSTFQIAAEAVAGLRRDNPQDQTSILEREGEAAAYMQRPTDEGQVKIIKITKDGMGVQVMAQIEDGRWKPDWGLRGFNRELRTAGRIELCFDQTIAVQPGEVKGFIPKP